MRLERPGRDRDRPRVSRRGGRGASHSRVEFKRILEETQEEQERLDLPLEELVRHIDELGGQLGGYPGRENLKLYEEAVREFLHRVTQKGLRVEKKSSARHAKREFYTIVKKVDTLLLDLAAEVLDREAKRLIILERVNEIRGLLVDTLR